MTAACSSSSSGGNGGADPNAIGKEPVSDAAAGDAPDPLDWDPDTGTSTCGTPQATTMASCNAAPAVSDAGDSGAPDAAIDPDAGDEEPGSTYGDPVQGTDADDDLCKYHVRWSAPPLTVGQPITFALDGVNLADGAPMHGAAPRIEAFLDETHVLATAGQTRAEPTPGHYTIGGISFDTAGTWTVRFHFFDGCTEVAEDSPAGHVAFLVDVK